jgi:hypothetical protein
LLGGDKGGARFGKRMIDLTETLRLLSDADRKTALRFAGSEGKNEVAVQQIEIPIPHWTIMVMFRHGWMEP